MKTKKLTLLLCTLCFFLAVFTLPAAAKSKSIPKKLFLSRKEILLYVGESKNLWVEKVRPAKASPKVTWYRPDSVTALRINRQDEAMIDYFHFEGETVK